MIYGGFEGLSNFAGEGEIVQEGTDTMIILSQLANNS